MTAKPTFSVETSCGEEHPSFHLYFGDGVRVQVAHSLREFVLFADHIDTMLREIVDTYPKGI